MLMWVGTLSPSYSSPFRTQDFQNIEKAGKESGREKVQMTINCLSPEMTLFTPDHRTLLRICSKSNSNKGEGYRGTHG